MFVVFSQMGFMLMISLGHTNMDLSMSAVGLGLGTKHSLNSFVRENSEEDDEEDNGESYHNEEVWPKPYGWETYSYGLIRRHFACKAYAHDQEKPLPTVEDWQVFQARYKETVDENAVFEDPALLIQGYAITKDGELAPSYAAHSADGRGRGLFASRDIKKGELTHDGAVSDVTFPDAASWRRFIFSLPRNRACDQIDWTWTQKLEDGGEYHILSAINISILGNSGKSKQINIKPPSSTSKQFYATRDIKKGEELLYNYGIYHTRWTEVGMGHDVENTPTSEMSRLTINESESNYEPVWPKPAGWESFNVIKIGEHFYCQAYARDQTKPLPTLRDWQLFRSTYRKLVDDTRAFDDAVAPTMGYSLEDGGPPPFYAGHTVDGKGRGIFASRDIKEGELTHDGARGSNVAFPDAASWRRFVFALPRNRACDVIDWTWTQQLADDGQYRIVSAMDISVLHNGGRGKDANVNPNSATSMKFYATRDIKKDEELLYNYDVYDTAWKEVGLL